MLLRILVLPFIMAFVLVDTQNYDTSDWIPITKPKDQIQSDYTEEEIVVPVVPKKATGRVLNLDTPSQKFFPDDNLKRRPPVQQFLRETSYPKVHNAPPSGRHHKQKINDQPYQFENVRKLPPPSLPVTPPKFNGNQPPLQYFNNKEVKLTVEQPPPLPQPQFLRQQYVLPPPPPPPPKPSRNNFPAVLPAPDAPNLYQQYNVNQSIGLNQEILGAIQKFLPQVGTESSTVIPQLKQELPTAPNQEKETVQLLYVPLENLKKPNQELLKQEVPQNFREELPQIYREEIPQRPQPTPQFIKQNVPQYPQVLNQANQNQQPLRQEHYFQSPQGQSSQHKLVANIEQDFIQQALQASKLQQQFQLNQNPLFVQPSTTTTTTTTPKPKKRKPHQPPLAVYLDGDSKADVSEVLDVLKDAKTISVQDSFHPNSPKLFIGPNNLTIPEGYSKFPLPYLSNVNGNRIDRKIEELPFFVAPLNYKAPPGYSKIPLPSPHVGSVVISHKDDVHDKHSHSKSSASTHQINQYEFLEKPAIKDLPKTTTENTISQPNYNTAFDLDQILKNQQLPTYYDNQPQREKTKVQPIPKKNIYNPPFYQDQSQFNPQQYQTYQNEQQLKLQNVPQIKHQTEPVKYQPEQVKYQPEQIKYQPEQIKYQPEQIKYQPENLKYQLEQVKHQPEQIKYQPEKVKYQPEQINHRPEQIKYQPEVRYQSDQVKYQPEQIKYQVDPQIKYQNDQVKFENDQQVKYQNEQIKTPQQPAQIKYQTPAPSLKELPKYQQTQLQYEPQTSSKVQFDQQFTQPQNQPLKTEIPQLQDFTSPGTLLGEIKLPQKLEYIQPGRNQYLPDLSSIKIPKIQPQTEKQIQNQAVKAQVVQSTSTLAPNDEYSNSQRYVPKIIYTPTETTKAIPSTEKPAQQHVNPLELAINEYELHQINKQLEPNKVHHPEAPGLATIQTNKPEYYEESPASTTTIRPQRSRPNRGRGRATRPTTTTEASVDNKYTVLEEFNIKPQVTTPQYVNEELYHSKTPSTTEKNVEIRPANVYSLNPESNADNIEGQRNVYESRPTYVENTPERPPNQHILNQELMDQQILRGLNFQPQGNQESRPNYENITPLVHNRGQYLQEDSQGQQSLTSNHNSQNSFEEVPKTNYQQTIKEQPTGPSSEELIQKYENPPATEVIYEVPKTTTEAAETTTQRRTRGRTRGNHFTAQTTTRRALTRRRPTRPSTTSKPTTDYEEPTRRTSSTRQRFRTRGRPNAITERISSSTQEFKTPILESGFQPQDPQSYMQFDHTVDHENLKIITAKPAQEEAIKDYHQVYTLQTDQGRKTERTNERDKVVDVQITHPVTEPVKEQIIQSGGVIYNNKNHEDTTTTRTNIRTRIRTRGRGRYGTTASSTATSTTTSRPKQTTTEKVNNESEEYYGFIRTPNYNKPISTVVPKPTQQPIQLYSASYSADSADSEITPSPSGIFIDTAVDSSTPVRFIGELRPKYQTTSLPEGEEESITLKARTRTRIPGKKVNKDLYNEVSGPGSDQATRRSTILRNRGRNHFKGPEGLKKKEENLEGQNYPAYFINKGSTSTSSTTENSFQITIDPNYDSVDIGEEDQSPHPSIYRPRLVPKPTEWVEATNPNEIKFEEKEQKNDEIVEDKKTIQDDNLDEKEKEDEKVAPEEEVKKDTPLALPVVGSIEKVSPTEQSLTTLSDDIYKETTIPTTTIDSVRSTQKANKGRRRGVWKLVRHRPVDHLETAESQNYESVLNSFQELSKVPPPSGPEPTGPTDKVSVSSSASLSTTETTTPQLSTSTSASLSTTKSEDEEGSLIESLYSMFGLSSGSSTVKPTTTEPATTTISPTFPEELTDTPVVTSSTGISLSISDKGPTVSTTTAAAAGSSTSRTPPYEVEPWEMRKVKTSTSTEVSLETEICYKGRCIKSKDKKIKT